MEVGVTKLQSGMMNKFAWMLDGVTENRVYALSWRPVSALLNRFACDRVDSLYQKCFEDSKSLTSESNLFFVESIRFCPERFRTIFELILSWLESTRGTLRVDSISLTKDDKIS
ncbi:hypothetical protein PIB30_059675 [Stylosanthes scabra]|uniref:Uncharacterized protein n=1 Tax=Stylosanthes scabra TaxID=79078 RepID=A0ABU6YHS2_9FABA|nr:hypothetical protein [Stylosanthes scabra]